MNKVQQEFKELLAILEETRKIERERCAKIAEDYNEGFEFLSVQECQATRFVGEQIAKAIRAQD